MSGVLVRSPHRARVCALAENEKGGVTVLSRAIDDLKAWRLRSGSTVKRSDFLAGWWYGNECAFRAMEEMRRGAFRAMEEMRGDKNEAHLSQGSSNRLG